MPELKIQELLLTKISAVALVDEGANLIHGIAKARGEGSPMVVAPITKRVGKTLYSLVFVPNMIDAHGHWMRAETIEKGCHTHNAAGAPLNVMHKGKALTRDQAFVAEQFILQGTDDRFPKVDNLGRDIEHKGAWAQITKILDPDLAGFDEVSLEIAAGDGFLVPTSDEDLAILKSKGGEKPPSTDTNTDSVMSDDLLKELLDGQKKQNETLSALSESNALIAKALAKKDEGESKPVQKAKDEPKPFDPFALPTKEIGRTAELRQLYTDFAVDITSQESYHKSLGEMTTEDREEFVEELDRIEKEYGGSRRGRRVKKSRTRDADSDEGSMSWEEADKEAAERLKGLNKSRRLSNAS